eukprot:gene1322-1668_t
MSFKPPPPVNYMQPQTSATNPNSLRTQPPSPLLRANSTNNINSSTSSSSSTPSPSSPSPNQLKSTPSPLASPQSSPTIPRRPPPQPTQFQIQQQQQSLSPKQTLTSLSSPSFPTTSSSILPPPPPFVNNQNNSNNTNNNISPQPTSPIFKHSPLPPNSGISHVRSTSLDNKTLASLLPIAGGSPTPQQKRTSLNNMNPRLSQDLNSLLANRLQVGLSPPVVTPYYDEKTLGNTSKTNELKERRESDERERIQREKVRKDKDDHVKKEKKEKKEKEEQEKKEKREKDEQEKKEKKKKDEQEKKEKKEKKEKDELEKKEKKKKEEQEKKERKQFKNSGGIDQPPLQMFNCPLSIIMDYQRERLSDYQNLPYPLILKVLTEGIVSLNGCTAEGIFRLTATPSELTRMKKQLNDLDFTMNTSDPHVLAGLLKLWLRELPEPIIPSEIYYDCLKSRHSKDDSFKMVDQLPELHQQVLIFLLQFLKDVSDPSYAIKSKMDIDNIAMVFAPGLLRCPTNDTNMLLNSQYEIEFIKNLIESV